MGRSRKNLATEGLSGRVGNFVFRRRKKDDKIFVARRTSAHDVPFTADQLAVQERFQEAVLYGKTAIADPATKAAYKAVAGAGQTAYMIAIADFFHAPNIETINVDNYHGVVGDTLTITATDNFKVVHLQVKIENADGSLVEQGVAVQSTTNPSEWIYTATAANASLTGDKITVTATDLPDNETVKQDTLS